MTRRTERLRGGRLLALALFLLLPVAARAESPPPFRVARYEIDLELLPSTHQLKARAKLEVVAREPLATLALELNENLKVEAATGADGKKLAFERSALASSLRVELPAPLASGQSAVVVLDYTGVLDSAARPERGALLGQIAAGQSLLLRPAKWFPQSANAWERSTFDLSVTVPAGELVVASGVAEPPRSLAGNRAQFRFRSAMPGLPGTLVAGKYTEYTAPAAGLPLRFLLKTVSDSIALRSAETLSNIVAFYSEKFGPLPNPALTIVEVPDSGWEAYSAPGVMLLPVGAWSGQADHRLLAREVARQWWQFHAGPASADDLWLADGFARYSEALYLESAAGEEALRQARLDLTVGALTQESAAPIADSARLAPFSAEFDSVVRDKGALVLHMLRVVLGDDAFFRLLRAYAERFAGRAATLGDFERLAEEVAGRPLGYFFGEWLRSTGVPDFTLDYVIYRTQKGFRVGGQVKHALEIFRMPVPIRIETEGPPVTQSVELTGPVTDFSIDTFGKPTRIQVDPDFHVLKYTPELRVRVAVARGEGLYLRGRYLEAVREYQRAVEVKRNSSLAHYRIGEAFFEQRNYQSAANAFREAIGGDEDPKWTKVWSHIFLGKVFDLTGQRERAINEYRRAVETRDDTRGAQEEAEKYLREPYRREERAIERRE